MDGTNRASRSDEYSLDDPLAPDLDGPSPGWFRADLREVLDALGERRALVAGIAARRRAEPRRRAGVPAEAAAPAAPDAPAACVPGHAIVPVGRGDPAGKVLPLRPRVLALAALLALSLAGLAWQRWPGPAPHVIPISFSDAVIVT